MVKRQLLTFNSFHLSHNSAGLKPLRHKLWFVEKRVYTYMLYVCYIPSVYAGKQWCHASPTNWVIICGRADSTTPGKSRVRFAPYAFRCLFCKATCIYTIHALTHLTLNTRNVRGRAHLLPYRGDANDAPRRQVKKGIIQLLLGAAIYTLREQHTRVFFLVCLCGHVWRNANAKEEFWKTAKHQHIFEAI